MDLISIIFYLFAAVLIGSACLVIGSRNPVHAVLFLILAFFNAAGLLVMIGAEFIAMTLVIVYVGAVAVLFLFVVMMLDINFEEMRRGALKVLPIALVVGGVLLAELVFSARAMSELRQSNLPHVTRTYETSLRSMHGLDTATIPAPQDASGLAGIAASSRADAVFDTDILRTEDRTLAAPVPTVTNTHALGRVLYTHYIMAFQVSGLILLVAMIGAIVLTLRTRPGVRRQKIADQVARKRTDVLKVEKVETGAGVS